MTNSNEIANMELNGDQVSLNGAVVGIGFFNWLTSAIQRVRDILDVDLAEWVEEGEDEIYFPTGGCCSF